ncbi:ribosome silencing factor [Actinomyces viscosus]|uniref:Ribosomal silencing factor RsfS n=1 Tax=Actinomyces viscosus TaxID=1656 RepID=A0A3S4VCL4_ACTVI|nr:ribosome silencing factor [Actinomyces viscosus]TFH53475.1 ribosome silencing factor [Actinomyces viscosus]VEI14580.1 ribosome-associated protein [Actinomyces viscosus]
MPATEHAISLTAAAARAAADKKAEHLTAIDVSERLGLTDVFLLASGSNDRHVHAIVDAVDEAMHRAGARRRTREGFADAHWVLVDYGDVVVHVLQDEDREFYSLERLWKDCPAIELPEDLTQSGSREGDEESGQGDGAS